MTDRLKTWIIRIADQNWFGPALGIVGSIVFALAALVQDRLLTARFYGLHPDWRLDGTVTAFWAAVAALFLLGWAKAAADSHARQELIAETKAIRTLTETLPARAFRDNYIEAVDEIAETLDLVAPRIYSRLKGQDLEKLIRIVLATIVELAKSYDSHREQVIAANVMVFRMTLNDPPHIDPSLEPVLFLPESIDRRSLMGVLVLEKAFSVSTTSGGNPDPEATPIRLPVPRTIKDQKGRFLVLPGAPKAFATGSVDGYFDTESLPEWFAKFGSFSPDVVDRVMDYFRSPSGRVSRSFMSIPLHYGGLTPVGVLNLHTDQSHLLGVSDGLDADRVTEERQQIFQTMIAPVVAQLAGLVASIPRSNPIK